SYSPLLQPPPTSTLFPYTTLFRSRTSTFTLYHLSLSNLMYFVVSFSDASIPSMLDSPTTPPPHPPKIKLHCVSFTGNVSPQKKSDRKSTRLNSSHLGISYAVFCLK